MAYDDALADRIRLTLSEHGEFIEQKMFGGIAFMFELHMCCGVVGGDLMVRVGPEQYEQALKRAHARPMDFTGRPMRGLVYVSPQGCRGDALGTWVGLGVSFVRSLPPKKPPALRRPRNPKR